MVRAATAEGLVAFDAEGRVVPALADRWIVTDDGLSYIFRMRDGLWADGAQLTGESGRDALREALAGLRGTSLGEDLSAIDEVRAMAGRVVEIRLSHPVPDLLDLLAQPELALLRKGRGTGATTARRDGGAQVLQPVRPERLGLPGDDGWARRIRVIRLAALPAATAVGQFEEGKVGAVFGGTVADYATALAASGLSRSALHVDPAMGLFGLAVASSSPVLATPDQREALAMALDRDGMAADLGISGYAATSRLVPSGAIDAPASIGERWVGMDMSRRRAVASGRLAKFRGRVLTIALPAGPGADLVFAHLQADLEAVGLTARRVRAGTPADLRLVDTLARYARADWFLNQFSCTGGRNPCSAAADSRAAAARAETDPAKRTALLEDAEASLTLANIFIPLGTVVRWSLVRGQLAGFATNTRGWHPLSTISTAQK